MKLCFKFECKRGEESKIIPMRGKNAAEAEYKVWKLSGITSVGRAFPISFAEYEQMKAANAPIAATFADEDTGTRKVFGAGSTGYKLNIPPLKR